MLTFILYQYVGRMVLPSDSLPIFQDTGIYPGECLNMSRVRLFPGFSTAVLQTGPLTLGVSWYITFWEPTNKLAIAGVANNFACMRSCWFVNYFPIVCVVYA